MNADLTQQLSNLLNDMSSVGVRHNALARRHYRGRDSGTIEVMLRDQRISLDFALGTVNGSHAVSCTLNGKSYAAPATVLSGDTPNKGSSGQCSVRVSKRELLSTIWDPGLAPPTGQASAGAPQQTDRC